MVQSTLHPSTISPPSVSPRTQPFPRCLSSTSQASAGSAEINHSQGQHQLPASQEDHRSTYSQPRISHLPPPYVPLDPAQRQPIDPSLLTTREQRSMMDGRQGFSQQQSGPSLSSGSTPSPCEGPRESVQLPSMTSWAPPSSYLPSHSSTSSPRLDSGSNNTPIMYPGSVRNQKRRQSDAEEVEAGIALAGLGMTRAGSDMSVKKAAGGQTKRAKKEEGGAKKAEKDNKKSCSECRRLKAKCDRVFPCSNCRRRGCALVCPDGDLSCMQGKRLVLASTEQLHERIAQLEAALSQAHSKSAQTSHPLLAPQYLDGGFASQPPPVLDDTLQSLKPSLSPSSDVKPSILDEQVSPRGRSSASSFTILTPKMSAERSSPQTRMTVESLLLDSEKATAEGKREEEWVGENAAPAMIVGNCGQVPTTDMEDHQKVIDRLRKILRILPSREETQRRAASFWENSQWYNSMLARDEFERIYEPAVYAPTPLNPLTPHKLACVLIVLTLDTYFDLSLDEDDPNIAEYWEGTQQCFDTRFGWAASVAGVQALGLATLFVGFGWRGARASNFYWLRQMTSAALQLGLHKDPHHHLPEHERDFRRRVFWDSYTIDCLMSINHGQRSAISMENVETMMPTNGSSLLHRTKYEYMRHVKSEVIKIGCCPDSAPASWEQIAATDRVMMQYEAKFGPHMLCPVLMDKIQPPISANPAHMDVLAMVRSTTSMCHSKAMMFLYRPSLRRLIARLRSEPQSSISFGEAERKTVLKTYDACHAITQTSMYMSRTHPRLSARCWAVWVQTFSAAVSMAALAIWCGPHLEPNFTASAYRELTSACEMFCENNSKRSQGVRSLLPVLQALVHNRYPQVVGKDPASAKISVEGEDMLFALLGGQVDQHGISPMQGNVMNPPLILPAPQNGNVVQPHLAQQRLDQMGQAQPGLQRQSSHPDIEQQQQQQPPLVKPTLLPGTVGLGQNAPTSNQNNQNNQNFMALPTQYNSMWQDQMLSLPLVASHPNTSPLEHYPMSFDHRMGGQNETNSGGVDQMDSGLDGYGMNTDDLWARLQTFYEPTPSYWGQSVGAVGVGVGGAGGYVDYSGMAMGM